MAEAAPKSPGKLKQFLTGSEMGMPLAIIGILALMILPLPPILLDVLIATNITVAILMLMTSKQFRTSFWFKNCVFCGPRGSKSKHGGGKLAR